MLDIAEDAGARANIAQHQESGSARAPALAHIGAHGFFANSMQRLGAHQGMQVFIGFTGWRAHFDPFGGGAKGGIDLFRETRSRGGTGSHSISFLTVSWSILT